LANEYEAAKLRWAGGAQRPVWRGNAPKKTGARSARARTRGQNPLVMFRITYIADGIPAISAASIDLNLSLIQQNIFRLFFLKFICGMYLCLLN
jgi:hypothetical protein